MQFWGTYFFPILFWGGATAYWGNLTMSSFAAPQYCKGVICKQYIKGEIGQQFIKGAIVKQYIKGEV